MKKMVRTVLVCLISLFLEYASGALNVPSVTLMNAASPGTKMPVTGIGTGAYVHEPGTQPGEVWTNDVTEKAVSQWLALGGRRIDASYNYLNQIGVGRAIKASNVPREELFVVSKVSGNGGSLAGGGALGYNDTMIQIKPILDTLQLDYVDLLLFHWPGPPGNSSDPACQGDPPTWRTCRQVTWKALEDLYNMGKTRAIGVANFEINHLEDIISMNSLLPAVNQVEFHPYWHEENLLAFCKSYNITFNGYTPLGCPDWAPTQKHWNHTLLQEPVIEQVAKNHGRTPAQVTLRWEWQQGVLVQPRSLNPDHMKENLNFFDFKLTDEEMSQISSITPPSERKVCPDPHQFK